MKALVLYRSFYGNTREVAETIGREISAQGHEAAVRDVRDKLPDLSGLALIAVGSPTRIKGANRSALRVLRKLKRHGFGDGLVAVFDTYGPVPTDPEELEKGRSWLFPGAAGALETAVKRQGLNLYPRSLRCQVTALKGPIAADAAAQATAFAKALAEAAGRG